MIEEIKAQGIYEIYCLSVNDAFVMRQVIWLESTTISHRLMVLLIIFLFRCVYSKLTWIFTDLETYIACSGEFTLI